MLFPLIFLWLALHYSGLQECQRGLRRFLFKELAPPSCRSSSRSSVWVSSVSHVTIWKVCGMNNPVGLHTPWGQLSYCAYTRLCYVPRLATVPGPQWHSMNKYSWTWTIGGLGVLALQAVKNLHITSIYLVPPYTWLLHICGSISMNSTSLELRSTVWGDPHSSYPCCSRVNCSHRMTDPLHKWITKMIEHEWTYIFSSVQSLSRVWLCDPMDCSMPGLPVHHQLPELNQTHVHRSGDAIQPSHLLLSPFPPALNLSQHRRLF